MARQLNTMYNFNSGYLICDIPDNTVNMVRKMRRIEGTESVTSSDSGTWVPEGEGFRYPSKRFTDPDYQQTSKEEGQKEDHPHDKNVGKNIP